MTTTFKTDDDFPYLKRWTMPDNYAGEVWPNYYSAGVGQSRDSDPLERSNFRVMLAALGGESDTVEVVHEGHWAVGWVEWIAIHQDDEKALETANDLIEGMRLYPVLCEDDYMKLELEEADQLWRDCYTPEERVAYIRKNRDQFEFRSWGDLRAVIRGDYFNGYASGLFY